MTKETWQTVPVEELYELYPVHYLRYCVALTVKHVDSLSATSTKNPE